MQSITVRTLIFDETGEKVLMVLNKEERSFGIKDKDQGWGMPGGRVRPDEKPEKAGPRELMEEAGVEAKYFGDPHYFPQGNHTVIVFQARNPKGTFKPQDEEKNILAVDWVEWRLLAAHPDYPAYSRHRGDRVYQSHITYINRVALETERYFSATE